ncbi:4-hydroxy-tetrahydrodipicolinate synthase [Paenisporosarcina cavernae]|uniref:4-hydroxy-tetrahydrodipicolinate synthase n=1 Tax=Paenisporosarcina cavernae TaxID=2320858 RepID=A0A385YS30_9BACL|nr:4-hydroxy-tetrahydrodipicolinate synthase [Paenisporosarcina cavernae]AYC29291.1 4-hydroxy-tetrahydrodipicolinate synthase [Paenisporosarcina cavernae]
MNIGKVSTAMITPFLPDGSIHFEMIAKIIEHLIANGSDSIVVCGTTGESPTLSHNEKMDIIRFTVETVDGRVPVIAGTGSNNTQQSIDMTQEAEEAGVDGAMLVTPYYNKPDQRGMYEHFKAIASNTNLPVLLYNIPGRSVVNMSPETILHLSTISNIVAVKEASGSLDQMGLILHGKEEEFQVYSGDDGLTLPLLAIGGEGIISVASHIIGGDMQRMIQAFESGDRELAKRIHLAMLPLVHALFAKPNPVTIKYALSKLGFDVEAVRLPLVGLSKDEQLAYDLVWDTYMKQREMFVLS